jgi:hypothetical protein
LELSVMVIMRAGVGRFQGVGQLYSRQMLTHLRTQRTHT